MVKKKNNFSGFKIWDYKVLDKPLKPSKKVIIDTVKQAGIVGAGGAGFPSHVKLAASAEVVIANGAECEPLLHVDKTAMELWSDLILRGLYYAMKACGAASGVVGVKKKNKASIESLESNIKKNNYDITLCLLENYYPAGDEHNLVNEVTGKIIPQLGLPLSRGAVVLNVTTLLNICLAIEHSLPVTHRSVTIAGEVKKSMTLIVPVGTRVIDLVSYAGLLNDVDSYQIIDGGPMMGNPVDINDAVISKATSGILVLPKDHYVVKKKTMSIDNMVKRSKTLCCQCRYCTDLCPRYLLGHRLEPHQIMRSLNYSLVNDIEMVKGALLCSECGICSMYACFMDLNPTLINKAVKEEFAKKGFRPDLNYSPVRPREFMETRKVPVSRLVNKINVSDYMDRGPFVREFPLPEFLEIPLNKHIGAPALPCVKVGDNISQGQVIGLVPEKALGAPVHASVNGSVVKIENNRIIIKCA